MKVSFLIVAISLFYSCKTNLKEKEATQTDSVSAKAPVQKEVLINVIDTLKIIVQTNSIPGNIDTVTIKKLSEPLKAVAAFYAAMGGTMCTGDSCELTTALGLGKQGSEAHKSLITKYFPGDKTAALVVSQDCYLRPSGASSFSEYQYLNLINLGDTVKVDYNLMMYDQGKTDWEKETDIYLFNENKFLKLKRNLWKFADN